MGKLSDFLGGFAGGLAKTMRADEEEKRRAEELKASQKAQLDYVRAAEAIRANFDAQSKPPVPAPFGPPTQGADGGYMQPTRIARGALFDEATGAVSSPASFDEGPAVPVPDPNALTPYQAATIDQRDRAAQSRIDAAKIRGSGGGSKASVGEDGLTPYQREQLSLSKSREQRLANKPASSGEGKPADRRKELMSTLSAINEAGGVVEVKNIIRAYGIDPNSQEVMNLQRGVDDVDYLDTLKGYAVDVVSKELKGKPKAQESKDRPADKPKDEKPSYSEVAAQVKAKRPDLTDAQIRQYLAGKGITP